LSELMSRLPIQLHHHIEDFTIEKGIEDKLYRILQEAVSNTLRHAEANSMHITLIKREMFIMLRILDDDKGVKMDNANTGAYGLEWMRERNGELVGNFKVVSLPNKSTKIEVKIPANEERGDKND